MPNDWNLSILCPVLKKADPTICADYNGISPHPIAYKVLTGVNKLKLSSLQIIVPLPNSSNNISSSYILRFYKRVEATQSLPVPASVSVVISVLAWFEQLVLSTYLSGLQIQTFRHARYDTQFPIMEDQLGSSLIAIEYTVLQCIFSGMIAMFLFLYISDSMLRLMSRIGSTISRESYAAPNFQRQPIIVIRAESIRRKNEIE